MKTAIRSRHLVAAVGMSALASLAVVAPASADGPVPVTADRITAEGLDIYYEVHGELSSDQTPVLLLHGGMGSIGTDFAKLLPALMRGHTVIGVEQQGHGRTGGRDAPITLASMRADTLAVLDALDVEKVHVVGFSMGGMLALELGVHAPERLATLTALSVSQNAGGMHPEIVEMNRDPSYRPSPEIAALMPNEEDFAGMRDAFADNPSGPDQFVKTFEALGSFINSDWGWSDEELAAIGTPTLLVVADRDFMPVGHVASMAEWIPHAQFAVLPDTTHFTITRRSDWLVPMIENRISTASR